MRAINEKPNDRRSSVMRMRMQEGRWRGRERERERERHWIGLVDWVCVRSINATDSFFLSVSSSLLCRKLSDPRPPWQWIVTVWSHLLPSAWMNVTRRLALVRFVSFLLSLFAFLALSSPQVRLKQLAGREMQRGTSSSSGLISVQHTQDVSHNLWAKEQLH